MSDEEDNLCPLCVSELDLTEKNFKPCKCGYQLCRFCWNSLVNTTNKCPACREPYSSNYEFTPPDPSEVLKYKQKKRKDGKKKKETTKKEVKSRKHLINMRVIQRNLVYVTNISLAIAKEDLLRKNEYFGQYGPIEKLVINKSNLYNANSPNGPSVSIYVTFKNKEDANACIKSIDGFWLENRTIRASFGTTKYCSFFLRNLACNNSECMYLHDLGNEEDVYSKEDISQGRKHHVSDQNQSIHTINSKRSEMAKLRKTILPPRDDIPFETPSIDIPPANNNHAETAEVENPDHAISSSPESICSSSGVMQPSAGNSPPSASPISSSPPSSSLEASATPKGDSPNKDNIKKNEGILNPSSLVVVSNSSSNNHIIDSASLSDSNASSSEKDSHLHSKSGDNTKGLSRSPPSTNSTIEKVEVNTTIFASHTTEGGSLEVTASPLFSATHSPIIGDKQTTLETAFPSHNDTPWDLRNSSFGGVSPTPSSLKYNDLDSNLDTILSSNWDNEEIDEDTEYDEFPLFGKTGFNWRLDDPLDSNKPIGKSRFQFATEDSESDSVKSSPSSQSSLFPLLNQSSISGGGDLPSELQLGDNSIHNLSSSPLKENGEHHAVNDAGEHHATISPPDHQSSPHITPNHLQSDLAPHINKFDINNFANFIQSSLNFPNSSSFSDFQINGGMNALNNNNIYLNTPGFATNNFPSQMPQPQLLQPQSTQPQAVQPQPQFHPQSQSQSPPLPSFLTPELPPGITPFISVDVNNHQSGNANTDNNVDHKNINESSGDGSAASPHHPALSISGPPIQTQLKKSNVILCNRDGSPWQESHNSVKPIIITTSSSSSSPSSSSSSPSSSPSPSLSSPSDNPNNSNNNMGNFQLPPSSMNRPHPISSNQQSQNVNPFAEDKHEAFRALLPSVNVSFNFQPPKDVNNQAGGAPWGFPSFLSPSPVAGWPNSFANPHLPSNFPPLSEQQNQPPVPMPNFAQNASFPSQPSPYSFPFSPPFLAPTSPPHAIHPPQPNISNLPPQNHAPNLPPGLNTSNSPPTLPPGLSSPALPPGLSTKIPPNIPPNLPMNLPPSAANLPYIIPKGMENNTMQPPPNNQPQSSILNFPNASQPPFHPGFMKYPPFTTQTPFPVPPGLQIPQPINQNMMPFGYPYSNNRPMS